MDKAYPRIDLELDLSFLQNDVGVLSHCSIQVSNDQVVGNSQSTQNVQEARANTLVANHRQQQVTIISSPIWSRL